MQSLLTKYPKIVISPLRIPVARTIQIPNNYKQLLYGQPTIKINLLRSPSNLSHLHKQNTMHKRYPSIKKCFSRKCICCKFLNNNSFIKSSVNNRNFPVQFKNDIT